MYSLSLAFCDKLAHCLLLFDIKVSGTKKLKDVAVPSTEPPSANGSDDSVSEVRV